MEDLINTQTSVEETTDSDDLIFEELNQSDDDNSEETEIQEETIEENTKAQQGLKVKYNGMEKELSYDDAIVYAQKGMNYDKLQSRYEALKNAPEIQIINRQANDMGMSTQEYLNYLDSFQMKSLENKALQQLQQLYPSENTELLQQLAKNQVDEYVRGKREQEIQRQQQLAQEEDEHLTTQVERFMDAYPDVNMEKLPSEVIQSISQGEDILSAYSRYENKLLRDRLNALEVNSKNRNKAVGTLTQNNSNENETDPFLQGLLG